jgi:hypothetical protein
MFWGGWLGSGCANPLNIPTQLARNLPPGARRTHQWLRELKRDGVKTYKAVQFYLPAKAEVYIGHYSQSHVQVTTSNALKIFEAHESGLGLEVIIPRPLSPKEIRRIYAPHPVSGWRFSPESKGKPSFCRCEWCNKGEIKARRLIQEA